MSFDLFAWHAPRDVDADGAAELVDGWLQAGGDPRTSPFEPSTDVGWFYRELIGDEPDLETTTDAVPTRTSTPIWLSATDEPPARVVGIRIPPAVDPDVLDTIFSLAAKYDLVVYDAGRRRVHLPLEEMGEYASATFWPGGAIQAAVAGGVGAVVAVVAWFLGIPVVSGVAIVIGGFMFVMAVFTFVHEGRKAVGARRGSGDSPPGN